MNIYKNKEFRTKYHSGFFRERSDVHTIVIHGTGGGDTLNWMISGGDGREDKYRAGIGFTQYIIERAGRIVELIDPDNWSAHSSSYIRPGYNADIHTIGIELENNIGNTGTYTEAQYNALIWLIFDHLLFIYPLRHINSHDERQKLFSGSGKVCPGPKFEWKRIQNEIERRGLSIDYAIEYKKKVT